MKNIGIITHYDVHNHGALLQLNALINIMRLKGFEAEALRFDKNYDYLGSELKSKYEIGFNSIGIYAKYLLNKGFIQTFFNYRKRCILENFKKERQLVGEYYSKVQKDLIIIGSDEVFALHTGPTHVFFGHGLFNSSIISYAASFGPTNLNDIQKKGCVGFIRSGLENMKAISVRDKNSSNIVKELTTISPTVVCDPVILYGYEKEIQSFGEINLPPYILVYAYDDNMNNPDEIFLIREFAKKNNLKIVSPGFYHDWVDYNINTDPIELLNYFKHSSFVITDTFHGSVMSIITNAQFSVITRGNSNKLYNLLEEYGLQNRLIDGNLDLLYQDKINFNRVNKEVNRRRILSMDFLNQSLK